MTQQIAIKPIVNDIRVIIIEDYKLTRVGLRYALNEIENINVIAEAQNAESGLEIIKRGILLSRHFLMSFPPLTTLQ